jgi:hypothetical protein
VNLANSGKVGKWAQEEDAKLTGAVKKHGKDWLADAKLVPGRTHGQCRKIWAKSLDQDRASNKVQEEHTTAMTKRLTRYWYD